MSFMDVFKKTNDVIHSPFDKQVDPKLAERIANDSQALTKDVNKMNELESGEANIITGFENELKRNFIPHVDKIITTSNSALPLLREIDASLGEAVSAAKREAEEANLTAAKHANNVKSQFSNSDIRFMEQITHVKLTESDVVHSKALNAFVEKNSVNITKLIEQMQDIVAEAGLLFGKKQYIIGAVNGIASDTVEILKSQSDMIRIAGGFDPKLVKDSMIFIKNENSLNNAIKECSNSINKIIDLADKIGRDGRDIEELDVDELAFSDIVEATNFLKSLNEPLISMRKHRDFIQNITRQIHSEIALAVTEARSITTDSLEIKARLNYLVNLMSKGVQHDFRLAPEHQRILDAEKRKIA